MSATRSKEQRKEDYLKDIELLEEEIKNLRSDININKKNLANDTCKLKGKIFLHGDDPLYWPEIEKNIDKLNNSLHTNESLERHAKKTQETPQKVTPRDLATLTPQPGITIPPAKPTQGNVERKEPSSLLSFFSCWRLDTDLTKHTEHTEKTHLFNNSAPQRR